MMDFVKYYCNNDHQEHEMSVNARDDQRFVKEFKKKRVQTLGVSKIFFLTVCSPRL